ncbi:TPA: terminase TerL endonuclease subunit [Bacillus nitratireducens]|nr:phage terminase, large subunit [Bacillus cereus AH1272]EEL90474.1 phage terminase, large subunit [Bacillus cereus AH1273]GCF75076.1 terminase [Bacillus cereus]
MNILEHKAYQYAKDVVDGKVVSAKYIKKVCQNFIDDVHDHNCKYFIDEKKLELITNLTKLINMPTGLRVGMSAHDALVGFQWFFIVNALCWYHKDDKEKRRYEKCVLLIARKSGKSFLVALVILLLMLTEPEFSEFFSVAPDRELSSIIKKEIEKMLEKSHPSISSRFKTVQKETRCTLTKSKFVPLATSDNRMDGRLASAFVADEVGALKTSYPIEAMESSQLNILNRLGILISTAYDTMHNPMVDQIEYAQKVMDGHITDETLFAMLYKPDNMKDWTSDEALLQANPLAIELPENLDELKKKRAKAMEMPSSQTNFKTKHLNIFVDGDIAEVYVSTDDLRKGKISNYNWKGRKVHIGVDLSQSNDNTAIAMVTYDEEIETFVAKVWAFCPEGRVEDKTKLEKVDYRVMERQGFCFFSGDKVINYGDIEKFVMDLENNYRVIIGEIGYDRYNAISSANKWNDAGYNAVEIKQHSSHLHSPTKLLKEMILNEKFQYEANQLFEINVANAREVLDTNLNGYVNKKKSTGKIDMLAALINAMYLWNLELLEGKSVYEDRGLIML